ncbi:(Fe-S)-binding protein [Fontisphaera persica]|uniref:(Fe-S)-binding protein n=1 Tax=Fontisphaera persica TaxID=2974023 RepID=UPI0024BF3766|nr:(Fe-S)-binding protein [Fontisphaera persica]WCJ58795.1 (Fe-S)-binding protein [Fontisphaera persica]
MKITLFIPCFIDQFYPQVGVSVVKILEKLGHAVEYPEAQTCCGQPAFNSGLWDEARAVAEHALDVFQSAEVIVTPSGSCGAMLRVFYPQLFAGTPRYDLACAVGRKTFEFSEFLVRRLGVTDVGAEFKGRATFHDGCHGLRELGVKDEPRQLLRQVRGLELVEMDPPEVCCGFGGTFAVKFPMISTAMGEGKCQAIAGTGADYVISLDSSCLMHLQGLLARQGKNIRCLHLAEVLAQSL